MERTYSCLVEAFKFLVLLGVFLEFLQVKNDLLDGRRDLVPLLELNIFQVFIRRNSHSSSIFSIGVDMVSDQLLPNQLPIFFELTHLVDPARRTNLGLVVEPIHDGVVHVGFLDGWGHVERCGLGHDAVTGLLK